jgi:hypothetical protein
VLNLLAVFPLATNAYYAGMLGWFSLLMPMAWPGTLLGLLWYLVHTFFAFFFPTRWDIDWPTGGFYIHGSIAGVVTSALGHNIGSFSFISSQVAVGALVPGTRDTVTAEGVLIHETGHALSNAALGPWFGLANAIENVLRSFAGVTTRNTYGEMIAESHMRSSAATARPWVDCWAPYVGPSAAGVANVPPAGAVVGPVPPTGLPGGTIPVPLGSPLTGFHIPAGVATTFASAAITDPDGYLLAAVAPPAGAATAFLWELTPNAQIAINSPTLATVTVTAGSGGDSPVLSLRVTDGVEGGRVALIFSVVEARPNGPYTGIVSQPVALTAAGTTAGTAGVLPSLAGAGTPALILSWSVTSQVAGSTPNLVSPTTESPTFTADFAGQYQVTLTVRTTTNATHSVTTTIDLTP